MLLMLGHKMKRTLALILLMLHVSCTDREKLNSDTELIALGVCELRSIHNSQGVTVLRAETENLDFNDERSADDPFATPDPTQAGLSGEDHFVNLLADSVAIDEELARRFVERAGVPTTISGEDVPEGASILVLSDAQIEEYFTEGAESAAEGWNMLLKEFPNATEMTIVSRVVYSEDAQTALMWIWQQSRGIHHGDGGLFIFRRIGRLWSCERVWDCPVGFIQPKETQQ